MKEVIKIERTTIKGLFEAVNDVSTPVEMSFLEGIRLYSEGTGSNILYRAEIIRRTLSDDKTTIANNGACLTPVEKKDDKDVKVVTAPSECDGVNSPVTDSCLSTPDEMDVKGSEEAPVAQECEQDLKQSPLSMGETVTTPQFRPAPGTWHSIPKNPTGMASAGAVGEVPWRSTEHQASDPQ